MAFHILKSEYIGLVLPLASGFELSFGTFRALARVIVRIVAESKNNRFIGLGEAAIDFPFSPYDAYDVLHALETAAIEDSLVSDCSEALDELAHRFDALASCPAALCALNQAFDDIEGQVRGVGAVDLYGPVRPFARSMQSIGITSGPSELLDQIILVLAAEHTPKPKVGAGLERDAETIAVTEAFARRVGFRYMLDFNGAYSPDDIGSLLDALAASDHLPKHAIAFEQPSRADLGTDALAEVRDALRSYRLDCKVIADESFLNGDDAMTCAEEGIGLNYKIQKVGGILRARAIERRVARAVGSAPPCMVGGTFPTALGRTYDKVAARVLASATLPADGWLPATSYFSGDRDLSAADDAIQRGSAIVNAGRRHHAGIGFSLHEERLRKWAVHDFRALFAAVRAGRSNVQPLIDLRGQRYADLYARRAHRPITWNLAEAAA